MGRPAIVIIPTPAIGHLVSINELARRLIERDDRLSVTILLMRIPFAPDIDSYTQQLAASDSPIQYITLPDITNAPPLEEALKSPENFISIFIENHKNHVKDAITNHVLSNVFSFSLVGLVLDLFCTSMIDVGNELGVPSFLYFPSSAALLGLMLHLPTRHDQVGTEFQETEPDLILPSFVNPLPCTVLPSFLLSKDGYMSFQNHARRFTEAKGIIVNTFSELEPHALNSFLVVGDASAPTVYPVGPLLDLNGQNQSSRKKGKEDHEILTWLDNQPEQSVVFLCFGNVGSFDVKQLKEIAIGLLQSECRFLWSIRRPPTKDEVAMPSDYEDYKDVLPDGFLEKSKDIGFICGWSPQKEVLAHKAIGGFVSHCGWNSIFESLWFNVPIVTLPLYAEQEVNALLLVKEWEIAIEMRLNYRMSGEDLVIADEVEKAVKHVMDGSCELRKRVKKMGEMSRKVLTEGGSSFTALGDLINVMLTKS